MLIVVLLSIMKQVALSIRCICDNSYVIIVMLSVIMLSVVILNVVMLSVVILNDVMLSVVSS